MQDGCCNAYVGATVMYLLSSVSGSLLVLQQVCCEHLQPLNRSQARPGNP